MADKTDKPRVRTAFPLSGSVSSSRKQITDRAHGLYLIINIDPVPKACMTRYGKNSRQARRTLYYQRALAWEILAQAKSQGISLDTLWGPEDKLELSANFQVTHNRRADLDNYLKALKDTLKWSGIIKDDSQIISYGSCKLVRKAAKGSVSISLRTINPVPMQIDGNANGISKK